MMPESIWMYILVFAAVCTVYQIFGNDRVNSSNVIAGVLSAILWVYAAFVILNGVMPNYQGATVWQSTTLFWLLLIIGVINGLFAYYGIISTISSTKNTNVDMRRLP